MSYKQLTLQMIFDQLDFKEEKVMDNEKIEKLQQMIDESNHIVFF